MKAKLLNIKVFFIILLVLILNANAHTQNANSQINGTVIIGIIRNDTIWIGADTKFNNTTNLQILNLSKIKIFKNFVYAHAGIFYNAPTKINFNQIFIESAEKGGFKFNNADL